MVSKGKFFAAFLLSAACGTTAAFGQTAPTPPRAPEAPRVFERAFEGFTANSGGYLGIQSQEVTRENYTRFGLRDVRGVAIGSVAENSPAAQAGIQANDVIVRFNGEEVTSVRKLTRLLSEVSPDHQVRMTVLRGGNEREITATLGRRPTPRFENGTFDFRVPTPMPMPRVPMGEMPRVMPVPNGRTMVIPPRVRNGENVFTFGNSRQIGVSVSTLNKQLGDYFGVADGKGLLVNNVRENSPAAKAGLRAGDVIVDVDGRAVGSTFDLTRAINEKKEGDVSLTIIRNKNRQTIRMTPEKIDNGRQQTFFMTEDDEDSN